MPLLNTSSLATERTERAPDEAKMAGPTCVVIVVKEEKVIGNMRDGAWFLSRER